MFDTLAKTALKKHCPIRVYLQVSGHTNGKWYLTPTLISKQSRLSSQLNDVQQDLSMIGVPVARHDHTEHLGLYLDSALNFSKHVKEAVLVALKGLT